MPTPPQDQLQPPSSEQSALPIQPLTACPKRRPGIKSRLVDGETVVLDRQESVIHQFNHTASYIWERCDGQSTLMDITHQLAHAFQIDPQVAARDVHAMIRQLEELHLLEWS
jgi:Coenzyme PQQ synthesis protein D (PqqD)